MRAKSKDIKIILVYTVPTDYIINYIYRYLYIYLFIYPKIYHRSEI